MKETTDNIYTTLCSDVYTVQKMYTYIFLIEVGICDCLRGQIAEQSVMLWFDLSYTPLNVGLEALGGSWAVRPFGFIKVGWSFNVTEGSDHHITVKGYHLHVLK